MEEQVQTPDETVSTDAETPTGESGEEGTEGAATPSAENEPNWRDKFSESSREAQRLFGENKSLKAEIASFRERQEQLESEQKKVLAEMQETNPDAARTIKLERELEQIKREHLLTKEAIEFDKFVSGNPDAKRHETALKKLYRADSSKDFGQLWEDNFRPAYEEARKRSESKKAEIKATKTEAGKGSQSAEPITDVDSEAFNKLPLAQRREALKKMGF